MVKQISMLEITETPIWVSPADGQKVFEKISAALLAGGRVSLSFRGRERVITAFLNVVIGQLYAGRIPEEALADNLTYVDLGDGDQAKIDLVVENAKRYFAARKLN
jgi:hypothetical protein